MKKLLSVLGQIVGDVMEDQFGDEIEIDDLPSINVVEKARTKLAKAAQKIYDEWEQDEEGYDEGVGVGGICHLIADELINVLDEANVNAMSVSCSHEVHVYLVSLVQEGIFSIDIRPHVYETGGGYTWKKIPDVEFKPTDILIDMLSPDHDEWKDYAE